MAADRAAIRRFAGRALVGGLSVAAAAAILALLTGDFGDTDTRVILSSIGFAFASATASSGATARLRPSQALRILGAVTVLASGAAFVLLLAGLWTNMDDWGSEWIWRSFGAAGVIGLAGSHACVMLGGLRRTDSDAVRTLTGASLAFGAGDALGALIPITGIVDEIEEPWGRIFGATLVALVLTSVLPPILRRIQPARADGRIAAEVIEIADRIEVLNADPGNRGPEIRAEIQRLRRLAETHTK